VNKSYQDKIKQYYRIAIDFENLEKFFKIILPYIPIEDMLYKGILIFKDKELQQR
jgi:flagellar motor switch protein FliM